MKKVRLTGLCVCLAALAMGCADDSKGDNVTEACGHGDFAGGVCVCTQGYVVGADGKCSLCASGFEDKGGECVKKDNPTPQPGQECGNGREENGVCVCNAGWKLDNDGKCTVQDENACVTTIVYKNCELTGKTLYLIGDFNEWKKEDANYKMTENNGVFSIAIDGSKDSHFAKDSSTKFKVLVGGESNDDLAYRMDPNVCTDGDDHNCALTVACGNTITLTDGKGESCGTQPCQGENCPCEGPNCGDPDACTITFQYTNVDTCKATCGDADFPVHVLGSMNNWDTNNTDFPLTADNNCVRTLVIDLNNDAHGLVKGQEYEYKFHVSGWMNSETNKDDGWRFDANGKVNGENNVFQAECGTVVKFDEKTQSEKTCDQPKDCGHGHDQDGTCVCDEGWKLDGDGKCTVEDKPCEGEDCKCVTTFKYYNMYTSKASGGVNDFSVHLVGDFNKDSKGVWILDDDNYKMTNNKGCHTIEVNFDKGSSVKYKYHVDGWVDEQAKRDDGWMQDPYNTNYDNDGNSTAYIDECGKTFGECPSSCEKTDMPEGKRDCIYDDEKCEWKVDTCKVKCPDEMPEGKIDCSCSDDGKWENCSKACTTEMPEGKKCDCVDGEWENCKDPEACRDITLEFSGTVESVSGGANPKKDGKKVTDCVPGNDKYVYNVKVGGKEIYYPVWVEDEKFDWHDAILYFAFTDRFADGDKSNNNPATDASVSNTSNAKWLGGDFKGMTEKVEAGYFDDLGVNTLWISSVSMNTQGISWGTGSDAQHSYSAYHSYWPISSFMTDANKSEFGDIKPFEPHFGTEAELKALVDACHKRGIRVLVDFAANHVHVDSPIYKNSKYDSWFNDKGSHRLCDDNNNWDNYSEKCWFSKDLPDINYDNGDARKAMVDHAIWLIKTTNIDGFRVDAVKHMNIQFIKDLRKAVDDLFKDSGIMFYMVGETFTGSKDLLNKYIGDDLLHAQFDFPLYYMIGNVLRGNGLYEAINKGQTGYKAGFNSDLMGTFMGNHDVARAISVANGENENKWGSNSTPTDWKAYDRLMAAWMILLTQPGVPLIYYGDEFGMPGSNDPDNRRMMLFGKDLTQQQQTTLEFVQNVAKIRRAHKALSRGERTLLGLTQGTSNNSTACYKMTYNGESVIVGIGLPDNYGHGPGSCDLGGSMKLENLFNGNEETKSTLDLSNEKFQLWLVK